MAVIAMPKILRAPVRAAYIHILDNIHLMTWHDGDDFRAAAARRDRRVIEASSAPSRDFGAARRRNARKLRHDVCIPDIWRALDVGCFALELRPSYVAALRDGIEPES